MSLHVAEDSPRNTIQTCQLFLKSLNLHYDLTNLSLEDYKVEWAALSSPEACSRAEELSTVSHGGFATNEQKKNFMMLRMNLVTMRLKPPLVLRPSKLSFAILIWMPSAQQSAPSLLKLGLKPRGKSL